MNEYVCKAECLLSSSAVGFKCKIVQCRVNPCSESMLQAGVYKARQQYEC